MTTIPMLQEELEQAYKDIKYYKNRTERLRNQLQQKENIIKEVREYIEKASYFQGNKILEEKELLEILDKGETK